MDELIAFAAALFEPGWTVELRCPYDDDREGATQRWVKASELPGWHGWMAQQQADGRFPCAGVNPRHGHRGAAIPFTLFADLDGFDEDAATAAIDGNGLPLPTWAQLSGGGVHLMWRLPKPLHDGPYKDAMRWLGERLGADAGARGADRVVRLPGFENRKPKRQRPDGTFPMCRRLPWGTGRPVDESALGAFIAPPTVVGVNGLAGGRGVFMRPDEHGLEALHIDTQRFLLDTLPDGQRTNGALQAVQDMVGRGIRPEMVKALAEPAIERNGSPTREHLDRMIRSAAQRDVSPRYHGGDARVAAECDSVPLPPPNKGVHRNEFSFVPLGALAPGEPPRWVWPGYVARGYTTLLSAKAKLGKSTLVRHVLADAVAGVGLCDGHPLEGPVLILSEEGRGHWSRHRDAMGLHPEQLQLLERPGFGRMTPAQWAEACAYTAEQAAAVGAGLVIVDTLASLWPCVEENDAGAVLAAWKPLHAIPAAGPALLVVHHSGKMERSDFDGMRGSSAITSQPDVLVEMKRPPGAVGNDSRRRLVAVGRLEGIADDAVLELTDEGYRILGPAGVVRAIDTRRTLEAILADAAEPLTRDEVRAAWPDEKPPDKKVVLRLLNEGHDSGAYHRAGAGVKGQPHRYSIRCTPVSKERTGTESDSRGAA